MKKTRTRTRLIVGSLVILSVVGVVVIRSTALTHAQGADVTTSQTGQVQRTTISAVVESAGSIEPRRALSLNFGSPGTVAQVDVRVGDHVRQGDVLAKLDTAALELQRRLDEQSLIIQQANYTQTLVPDPAAVASTQAGLTSAQAAYAAALQQYNLSEQQVTVNCAGFTQAKDALERAQTAYDRLANDHQAQNYLNSDWGPFQSVVQALSNAQAAYAVAQANCNLAKSNINAAQVSSTQAQVTQAQANLDNLLSPDDSTLVVARVQLEQARLNLRQTRLRLADAEIVAPFDGIVTQVNLSVGEASGGASIDLADVSQFRISVLVDETEITNVQPGQTVEATLDGLPGLMLTGKVARIDPSGILAQGVVNYNVQIDLAPTTAPVRLYMTANVRIIRDRHAEVLAVPIAAIRTDPNGASYVEVLDSAGQPNGSRRVNVTLGLIEGAQVEVSGDLQAGDRVLITVAARRTTSFFGGQ
ncbi:MAG TPA: efflux RND transporter periplasmic adaptor subunit [Anaerolineae bacterium]|nr:efflux RND transporter periplasmic adaptor subunit [Anaerolineae bacterium]